MFWRCFLSALQVYLYEDSDDVARGFYTDTYYSDQNACSSPRLVVWLGNRVDEAREVFWEKINTLVENDYEMKPIQATFDPHIESQTHIRQTQNIVH